MYKQLEIDYGNIWRRGATSKESQSNRQFWKGRLDCIKEIERVENETKFSRELVINMIIQYISSVQSNLKVKKGEIPWLIKYFKQTNPEDRTYRIS